MSPLITVLFLLLSAVLAEEKRGVFDEYLENFDVECLNTLKNDQAAMDALKRLQDMNLQNTAIDPDVLIDVETLELSDHLVCSTQSSAICGEVQALPPRDTSEQLAQLIATEFESKTDDELLSAFKYNITGLCATLAEVEVPLEPHKECISRNLAALSSLPAAVRAAVLEILEESTGGSVSPLKLNLTTTLLISGECEDFKSQVVSNIRSQMSESFWNSILLAALTKYDVEAFNALVQADLLSDTKALYGCTIPRELICTNLKGVFFSACELNVEKDFDFMLGVPLDGDESDVSYLNSYRLYNEAISGFYPCMDTFKDVCFGEYLKKSPSIPDLMLEMTCTMPGYYYSRTGETPPPVDDGMGDGDMGGGDDDDNPDDGSDDGSDDGNNEDDEDDSDAGQGGGSKGLSAGGAAAVALSVIGLVSAAGVAGFFFMKKRKDANLYQVQLDLE